MRLRNRTTSLVLAAALCVAAVTIGPIPAAGASFDSPPVLLAVWGGPGAGAGHGEFDAPQGIAVGPDGFDQGFIYVADSGNHRILRYDAAGNVLKRWGDQGSGDHQFQNPWGVDASPYGIHVADTSNGRVVFMNHYHEEVFLVYATLTFPTDVAFWQPPLEAPAHWVLDGPEDTVLLIEIGAGVLTDFGDSGGDEGEFQFPHGIAVAPDATVYVADTFNHRIQRFDNDGTFLTAWGEQGSGPGQFDEPRGIAVGPDGTVFVADKNNHRIQAFTQGGDFLVAWGSEGSAPGQFDEPRDVAVAPNGTIYVADTGNNRVQVFSFDPPPTVGLVDPTQGQWHLRNHQGEVKSFYFGNPGDFPFMGDWNCDGIDTPGMYRQSDGFVYLRNSNTQGVANVTFFFGNPGDVPIAGDFNGDGCDTVSIYRPSNQTFYIINALGQDGGGLGAATTSYVFGNPGDKPFTGDFNGNGRTTVGLHRESTGFVYFRNTHTQGNADNQFFFGDPNDRFITGDWNANGTDTPGLFRPSNTTFYFRHTNTQGNADAQFVWGQSGWLPVSGVFGLG